MSRFESNASAAMEKKMTEHAAKIAELRGNSRCM